MTKKEKSEYDENGHWVQERNRIKGAVRRVFRLFPQMKDVLNEARVELPPALKKDGTPGKRNQVRFRCAICKDLYSRKNVQVDHIDPVVPLWKKEEDMTYDQIVRGVCCNRENLQVVCSTPMKRNGGKPSCHKIKTDEENFIRRGLNSELDIDRDPKDTYLDRRIDELKEEYKDYVIERERKRLEKEERKLLRELKKKGKK